MQREMAVVGLQYSLFDIKRQQALESQSHMTQGIQRVHLRISQLTIVMAGLQLHVATSPTVLKYLLAKSNKNSLI